MNTELEDQLIESMRHRVHGVTLTGDVLGRATSRHQRRTAKVRIGLTLGVTGLAGAVAAGVALGNGAPPSQTAGKSPAVQSQTPALRLVAAATASDEISYRLRGNFGTAPGSLKFEGAFDPRTDTGYVREPQDDSVATELLINGTRYMGGERPQGTLPPDKGPGETYGRYGQYPGKFDRLSIFGGDVLGAARPDPAGLLQALKAADATTTENPDGSLHFTYTTTSKEGSSTTSGDVTLNGQGRIAKVVTSGTWQATKRGKLVKGTFSSTLELYDYGLEVHVKRPADVVPAN